MLTGFTGDSILTNRKEQGCKDDLPVAGLLQPWKRGTGRWIFAIFYKCPHNTAYNANVICSTFLMFSELGASIA